MRQINEIILHCTATRPDWMAGSAPAARLAEIRRWHVEQNGWRDIGYHFVIDRAGQRLTGRPLAEAGAHVAGRNARSIGIALIGGFGAHADDAFEAHFTPAQDQALRALLSELLARFPQARLSGHNAHAAKACPGFQAGAWYHGAEGAAREARAMAEAEDARAWQPGTSGPGLLDRLLALFARILSRS